MEFIPDGTISHIPANGSLSLPIQQASNLKRRFSLFPSRSATADDRPASSGKDSASKANPTSKSTSTTEPAPRFITIKFKPITQIVVPLKAVYARFVELNENKNNTILSIPVRIPPLSSDLAPVR
jgi:hypothetical protein